MYSVTFCAYYTNKINFLGDSFMHDTLKECKITDSFFTRYENLIKDTVIPYQEKILKDEIPGAEKSHAIANFIAAAEKIEKGESSQPFYGMVFQDSDVAKWLEGAAYTLLLNPDKKLEDDCDKIISIIQKAQLPDGYLNTYFTVKDVSKRWTNLAEAHELYCAGHMIEAAVAFAECLGKTSLLDIMCKMVDCIYKRFIEEKHAGYPGHPEVELALMRLYHYTKNKKHLDLALHFINARGVDSDYFRNELKNRGWVLWSKDHDNKEYALNHKPVREQTQAVGHAVRAAYLYTGMADAAKETSDKSLVDACKTLWTNLTTKRMYITGAIGSAYEGEAFTEDYHLPNDAAYAETCASIGLIFFARQMIELDKNSKYADVMEKALYNCVLAGMQLDGKRFFYVNPLEVIPGISGKAASLRHSLPERPGWFVCACCPPNVARLLPSLGRYIWSVEDNTVYSNLFIGSSLDVTVDGAKKGEVILDTGNPGYPYSGNLTYTFKQSNKNEKLDITLALRIPEFDLKSKKFEITRNGKKADFELKDGYAYIKGPFTEDDKISLVLDMSVHQVFANPKVSADDGKVAFMKGPLVYCAEGIDNNNDILSKKVIKDGKITCNKFDSSLLQGVQTITVEGKASQSDEQTLYSCERPKTKKESIELIPYYAWGNRGLNQMRVWLPED